MTHRADCDPSVHGRRAFLAGASLLLVGPVARAVAADGLVLKAAPLGSGAAFNGEIAGPTLRIKLGEPVVLRLDNGLHVPVGLVFDGVRDNAAVAGTLVAPGSSAVLRFTPPDAGTFGYRATGPAAAMGDANHLRGVLIIEEGTPPSTDADLLVALDDDGGGVSVNGKVAPAAATIPPGGRMRLRLVNNCASRIAIVTILGARPSVIAVDGQPSALFMPAAGTLPIGPGAGFDLMLDAPDAAGASIRAVLRGDTDKHDQPLLTVTSAGKPAVARPPIAALPPNPRLPQRIALEKAARHTLAIASMPDGRWSVNGVVGPTTKPLFTLKRGTPVVLTWDNRTTGVQPVQVAGQCWRILHDLDDGWDPYWRNTLLLAPGKTKHVAFVPDAAGRWPLGSGDATRALAGLTAAFDVR